MGHSRPVLSRGHVTDFTLLQSCKTLHILGGLCFLRRFTISAKLYLCSADVPVEVTLKIKNHLVLHAGESHPAGHFPGYGIIQYPCYKLFIWSPCHLSHLSFLIWVNEKSPSLNLKRWALSSGNASVTWLFLVICLLLFLLHNYTSS